MARTLTPQDCYALMNALVKEATGGNATIQAVDTSSFVSAGELALSTGTENVLNSLSLIIGKTLIASRPYQAKLAVIRAINSGAYTNRLRKISYYDNEAVAAGAYNTQLYSGNLKDGVDNGSSATATASQWVQNQKPVLEMNFGGSSVWQYEITVYEDQLKEAFTDESSFGSFVSGLMTEAANDMESEREAFNRAAVLNHIAAVYDASTYMPGSVIDLTTAYNAKFGTSYTRSDLLGAQLKSFLEFFVATFKITSDRMTERTTKYHWTPARTGHVLLRHTPKADQRAILYGPLFTDATANVLPEIFSPQYLGDITQGGELVTYWQNSIDSESAKIDITPAIPDLAGAGTGQTAGTRVQLPYVVGMLFDKDAIVTDMQLDSVYTTSIEARKHYRNVWYTFKKNIISDLSENTVLFVMS